MTAVTRRLAAIMVVDVVGYSRRISDDETATLEAMRALWNDLVDPAILKHAGRAFKSVGDGKLVEFSSAVDAVACALAIQNGAASTDLPLRIGVHIGDVVADGDDMLGAGVNIAARLQQAAPAGGILLSGAVHDQIRGKIHASFADIGEIHLKNIDTPMPAWKWPVHSAHAALRQERDSIPSLAVLPFVNLSQNAEHEFFADGLVEDMITTLSKLSGLTVIARHSSFLYKHRQGDVREVARALGVRFVLEGSVRWSGAGVRISAQLIDAAAGTTLWGERYDRRVDDIFALQDEITLIVATELQAKLTEGEQARLRYATTHNVGAWTLYAQGLAYYRSGVMTPDGMGRSRALWQRALQLDPNSAVLHALLANVQMIDARLGWWDARDKAVAIGMGHVAEALKLDPDCADAHMSSGMLLTMQRRFDEAENAMRRALELAPGSADIAAFAAVVLTASGAYAEAIAAIERAMKLSPTPPANYLGIRGNACRLAGKFTEAIEAFQAYSDRIPGFGSLDLAIIYHRQGRLPEAHAEIERALAARPNLTVKGFASTQVRRNDDQLAEDLAALRAAGLPA
jgi:adenylate cyclase